MKRILFGLGLAALLITGSQARADNIDDGLLKLGRAEKVMKYLRDHKYKNVGVLRFEVKKGKAPATMSAGQLNSLMADRLENALIYVNDLKDPIGVTRGASIVAAAKGKGANYHTNAGRQTLFLYDYPLAWGTQSVKVDAFLTGRLEISEDFANTKVIIQAFDKKKTDVQEVLTFTVKTDRPTLRDMGQTFVISKRSLNLKARDGLIDDDELDSEAIKDVNKDNPDPTNSDPTNKDPKDTPKGSNNIEEIKQYLDFQILIDDMPATITPHGSDSKIDMPKPDQKVTIKLNAKAKLGLVLMVNGVNTLGEQKDNRPKGEYSMWILEPNKDYTIRGFYKDDMVKLFKVLAKADVNVAEELGEKQEAHGTISLDVWVDKGMGVTDLPTVQIKERKTVSLRKTTSSRATSLSAAQKQVAGNLSKVTKRDVFIVGRETGAAKLESGTFTGDFFVGSCNIFYNLP